MLASALPEYNLIPPLLHLNCPCLQFINIPSPLFSLYGGPNFPENVKPLMGIRIWAKGTSSPRDAPRERGAIGTYFSARKESHRKVWHSKGSLIQFLDRRCVPVGGVTQNSQANVVYQGRSMFLKRGPPQKKWVGELVPLDRGGESWFSPGWQGEKAKALQFQTLGFRTGPLAC